MGMTKKEDINIVLGAYNAKSNKGRFLNVDLNNKKDKATKQT